MQWVITGYLLSLGIVIPLTGWMSEHWGAKRVWISAVVFFTLGSALCGLAWSAESLIFFRVLQGFGGGMIMPVGMALMAQTAGPHRVGQVMAVLGVPTLLGPILGPVLGGVIVDNLSWRWIFLVNLPIGLLATVGGTLGTAVLAVVLQHQLATWWRSSRRCCSPAARRAADATTDRHHSETARGVCETPTSSVSCIPGDITLRRPVNMRTRLLVSLLALSVLLCGAVPAYAARKLGSRSLTTGVHGHDVKTLQRALTRLRFPARPIDGEYGRKTAGAVRRWKRARELRVNGRLTRRQARRVRRELIRAKRASAAMAVGPGASGAIVLQVQRDLGLLRFYAGAQDGLYGPGTTAAIMSYQRAYRARATGGLSVASVAGLRRRAAKVVAAGDHRFPVLGAYSFNMGAGRYGDDRGSHIHAGQDIAAASNTPVVAVTSGVVSVRAYQASGAGNYLVLQGDDGFDYVYMHLIRPAPPAKGTRVAIGQPLGNVGATGRAAGPHLHFEAWTAHWYDGGRSFDPLPALHSWR